MKVKRNGDQIGLQLFVDIIIVVFVTIVMYCFSSFMGTYLGVELANYFPQENYFDILAISYSVVFLTTSLLGMLSDKENTIYWVNVNEYVLINPKVFNYFGMSTLGFVSLIVETIGCIISNGNMFFSGFIIGIASMIVLFYKMTTIHFKREYYMKKLKKEYIKSIPCEEKINYDIKEKIELLKANTLIACEQRKYVVVTENLNFLYDIVYKSNPPMENFENEDFFELIGMLFELNVYETCRYLNGILSPFMNTDIDNEEIKVDLTRNIIGVLYSLSNTEIQNVIYTTLGGYLDLGLAHCLTSEKYSDEYLENVERYSEYIVRACNVEGFSKSLKNNLFLIDNPVFSESNSSSNTNDYPEMIVEAVLKYKKDRFDDYIDAFWQALTGTEDIDCNNGDGYWIYLKQHFLIGLNDAAMYSEDIEIIQHISKYISKLFFSYEKWELQFAYDIYSVLEKDHKTTYMNCLLEYLWREFVDLVYVGEKLKAQQITKIPHIIGMMKSMNDLRDTFTDSKLETGMIYCNQLLNMLGMK